MWIRSAHYLIGALTLILFIISGQYMGLRFQGFSNPELYNHNEVVRYLYRANHIYLLLPAFINLLLGSYLTLAPGRGRRIVQYIGSALLLVSTVMLLAAFMIEPSQASPERPWTYFGLITVFGGSLLHLRFPSDGKQTAPIQNNIKTATNEQLKSRAVDLLAQGVIPYANWAVVFANKELMGKPNLQAKAFHIWFPTMLDYLSGRDEGRAIKKELDYRNQPYENLFDLSDKLEKCFKDILSMYTADEQIFIWDRRLQNVHGKLQVYVYETHSIKIYEGKILNRKLSASEYQRILNPLYQEKSQHNKEFIIRFLTSKEFEELTELYVNELDINKHLTPLINKLEVAALIGNN